MGEIGLVMVQVLVQVLVLTGVLFNAWIVGLSEVVEGAQVWLILY